MDIDDRVKSIIEDVCVYGTSVFTGLKRPEINEVLVAKSRFLCAENKCGKYGTSWTCPPNCGSPGKAVADTECFTACAVISRRFYVDIDDRDRVGSVLHAFQEVCRNVKHALKRNGIDCMVMAGGPCTYCSECAIFSGDPCRFPDKQIPSVSPFGIEVYGLLSSNGIEVEQPEGTLTFFGVILY